MMYKEHETGKVSLLLLANWSVILSGIAWLMTMFEPQKNKVESEFDFTFDFDDYIAGKI
ncbi:MAG: hypothetical protein JXM68_02945 [Sedimentisphaerales bacterium]|nr:hypothetical protein [Sedimentisphaerales bacterium]